MPAIPFGQLLINNALPPQYRDYKRVLDGKGMEALLSDVAANHPEQYAEMAQKISDVGREVSYLEGETLSLDDNISPIERKSLFKHVRDQMRTIQSSDMSDKEKDAAIEGVFSTTQKGIMDETVSQGIAKGNRYAMQIASKSRGNPLQMTAITTTPSFYRDAHNKVIPIFIEHSYAEGLKPHEYWASTYGARSGICATKFCIKHDTPVLMSNYTERAVGDLKVGDEIFAVQDDGILVPTKVTAVFDTGIKPCIETWFATKDSTLAHILIATKEHKVWCKGGTMIPLGSVVEGKLTVLLKDNVEADFLDAFEEKDCPTVDIEIEHPSHRFLLANGLVVSNSTREGGDMAKQLTVAGGGLVVTEDNCGTLNGVPVPVNDIDNSGAVLARAYGPYKAGTPINKSVQAYLHKIKGETDEILVRSPMTCQARSGVCKHCAGVRETGGLPDIGYNLGVVAGSAIAEQISQGALQSKHTCLVVDTEVLMGDFSTKKIQDIVPGDTVIGSDLKGNTKPVKVTRTFNNGDRDCYRSTFAVGSTKARVVLESTLEHKVLALKQVSSHSEEYLNNTPRVIPVGSKAQQLSCISINSFDDNLSNFYDEPRALLIGLLLGDGCYTEAVGRVTFSCADTKLVEDLKPYLTSINVRLSRYKYHNDIYYGVANIDKPTSSIDASGRFSVGNQMNSIKRYLIDNDMYGKLAHDKEIPVCAYRWSNKSIAQLISGLIITDGSVYSGDGGKAAHISFSSTSHRMILQLQWFLKYRLGIHSSVTTGAKAGSKITHLFLDKEYVSKHDQYKLCISTYESVQKFCKLVELYGVKKEKLANLNASYIKPFKNSDYSRMHRKSQEHIGMRPTFDIEVDHPDHLFVLANGLIVSNSGQKIKGSATYTGFPVMEQMMQVPKAFPNKATVSELDGQVEKISPAPQGGWFVDIGGHQHYLEKEPSIKVGATVEAGDALSEGLVNPSDVVRLKGIGEGRRYFANNVTQIMKDSGWTVNRRNAEAVSRSMIDNVNVQDFDQVGDYLPGDKISYNNLLYSYKPRKEAKSLTLGSSRGKYLEQPLLHYSIGTRMTGSVINAMKKHGVQSVVAHDSPPAFEPEMVRLRAVPYSSRDWLAKLWSSNLKDNLLKDVATGASTDLQGTHPIPRLVEGLRLDEGLYTPPKKKI